MRRSVSTDICICSNYTVHVPASLAASLIVAFQAVAITGAAPSLIACVYCCARCNNAGPVTGCPYNVFTRTCVNTRRTNCST